MPLTFKKYCICEKFLINYGIILGELYTAKQWKYLLKGINKKQEKITNGYYLKLDP